MSTTSLAVLTPEQIDALAWDKGNGLLPAIVQDARSCQVLMLGYMNREALRKTLDDKRVTFFTRSRNRLWTKGETSGNFLNLVAIAADCDNDTLLITAHPDGPTCHTGTDSCFGDSIAADNAQLAFLTELQAVIAQRIAERPEGSYTTRLLSAGTPRIAQKVGEEGVEVALAAVTQADDKLVSESADLLFHLMLLLQHRNLSLGAVVQELQRRHKK